MTLEKKKSWREKRKREREKGKKVVMRRNNISRWFYSGILRAQSRDVIALIRIIENAPLANYEMRESLGTRDA